MPVADRPRRPGYTYDHELASLVVHEIGHLWGWQVHRSVHRQPDPLVEIVTFFDDVPMALFCEQCALTTMGGVIAGWAYRRAMFLTPDEVRAEAVAEPPLLVLARATREWPTSADDIAKLLAMNLAGHGAFVPHAVQFGLKFVSRADQMVEWYAELKRHRVLGFRPRDFSSPIPYQQRAGGDRKERDHGTAAEAAGEPTAA